MLLELQMEASGAAAAAAAAAPVVSASGEVAAEIQP